MKTINDPLYQHLQQDVTTLCTVWRLTFRPEVQREPLGFTDLDRDLTIENIVYHASTGFTPTAIDKSVDLSVDNLDIEGLLEDDRITEVDLMAGAYDFARVDIAQVNYRALPDVFKAGDVIWHVSGYIGEVRSDKTRFKAEMRSMTQMLSQTHGIITSRTCRANLGDGNCGIDYTSKIGFGTAVRVSRNREFQSNNLTQDDGFFDGGNLKFLDGELAGLSFEVAKYSVGHIRLFRPPPYTIGEFTPFSITPGCDKTIETCKSRWNNVVNFRGFPHIPGVDTWQAGRANGIIDVMETLKHESDRLNPNEQQQDDKTEEKKWDTAATPTGNVF